MTLIKRVWAVTAGIVGVVVIGEIQGLVIIVRHLVSLLFNGKITIAEQSRLKRALNDDVLAKYFRYLTRAGVKVE